MKHFYYLFFILLVACNPARKDSTFSKSLTLKTEFSNAIGLITDYDSHPDTFTMFFLPTTESVNFNSALFEANQSYRQKIAAIMKNITKLSDQHDLIEKELYALLNDEAKVNEEMATNNCFEESSSVCDELQAKLEAISLKKDSKSAEKAETVRKIQISLGDNPDDADSNIHWQFNGVASDLEFRINPDKSVKISIIDLGPQKQKYTTKAGDIFDTLYTVSDYNATVKLLKFKLWEKDKLGNQTGYYYDFKLEESKFVNKVRYAGDVFKKYGNGGIVQRGLCKFELPPK